MTLYLGNLDRSSTLNAYTGGLLISAITTSGWGAGHALSGWSKKIQKEKPLLLITRIRKKKKAPVHNLALDKQAPGTTLDLDEKSELTCPT